MKRIWKEIIDRLIVALFFIAVGCLTLIMPRKAIKTVEDFLAD